MNLIGKRARKASQYKIDTKIKNNVLASYAKMLDENKGLIIKENTKDINYAKKIGLKLILNKGENSFFQNYNFICFYTII